MGNFDAKGGPDIAVANRSANSVTLLLNRLEVGVAVSVADLAATTVASGVRLAWGLVGSPEPDLRGVGVQRADGSEGPYFDRTPEPLPVDAFMEFIDENVEVGNTYWYRLILVANVNRAVGPVAIQYAPGPAPKHRWMLLLSDPLQNRFNCATALAVQHKFVWESTM